MTEAGPGVEERITYGFRLCVARRPKPQELKELVSLFDEQLSHFQQDRTASAKIAAEEDVHPPEEGVDRLEFAAWSAVAGVVLNAKFHFQKE